MNIFVAEQRGQAIHGLVGFLRHRFLHLNLKDQVRAALQVKAKLDLAREIILELREGRRKGRQTENRIQTKNYDCKDEYDFPLQIGIHG